MERLMIAGGGGANDSRLLDEKFATAVGPHGRVLYWPFALAPLHQSFDSAYAWFTGVFNPLGLVNIDMWATLAAHSPSELADYDAIYIGGGNTYHLLQHIRAYRFDEALLDFIHSGRPLYGGSAGAAILGSDISTVAHMDRNDVGLVDMKGLNVLRGYAVWCHYMPSDDARIAAFLATTALPLLVLTERAGVDMDGGHLNVVGYDPIICWSPTERIIVQPYQTVP